MSRFEWPSIGADGRVIERPRSQATQLRPPTADELEAVYEQARREGHAQGMSEAAVAAEQAQAAQLQTQQQAFETALAEGIARINEQIERDDMALRSSIEWLCRETVEQALLNVLSEPESMPTLVDALLQQIPGRTDPLTVFVHPDQAHRVTGAVADPGLASFAIRIETQDASLEHDPMAAVHDEPN
ncbi:hypothetical protein GH975_06445 [Litorivicinus lipolyticus]|uniref:Flagellar assembly protein FliH/Type III secretion system HrpE domain-containing protein n=1 Tax=Litorivicinus lipolyticus TaxID=418701 RepID=A0A5Q2QGU5_9GAMM|nr:hypothetical protein [Litorivicinus lipolyticus]QGG80235.1 hypothetical protein GH975_06445 [Litorivicinus lipolyticus]